MASSKSKAPIIIIIASLVIAFAMTAGTLAWRAFTSDAIVLKPNVVIYEEDTAGYKIVASSTDSITVTSLEGLEEGQVLTAGITEATPNGLLCTLGEPTATEGGYIIPITQASFTDVFEECSYSASATLTEAGNYEIESRNGSGSPIVEQAFALTLTNPLIEKDYGFVDVSAGNSVDLNLQVRHGTDFKVSVIDSFNAEVKIDGTSGRATLFDDPLRPIEFKAGPVPVVVVPALTIEADVNASIRDLTFEAGAAVDRKMGFEYDSQSGLYVIDEDNSTDPYLVHTPIANDLNFKVNAGVTATMQATLYGLFGAETTVALRGDFTGKLKEVAAGEPTEGAISIPGSDRKYAGRLTERITVPISGSLVVNAPNSVVDLLFAVVRGDVTNFSELARMELFDTGDLIVLYDDSQTFGQILETYEIDLGHGLPVFEIDYPDNWTVGRMDFNYPTSDADFMVSIAANRGGVTITCNDNPDASVSVSFLTGYPSGTLGLSNEASASLEKIASSSLAAPDSGTTDNYCVAQDTHALTRMDDMSPGHETYVTEQTTFYALIPNSALGSGKTDWRATNAAIFPYGTWPEFPGRDFYILVYSSELDGMTNDQRQEALEIIESFRRM